VSGGWDGLETSTGWGPINKDLLLPGYLGKPAAEGVIEGEEEKGGFKTRSRKECGGEIRGEFS